MLLLLMRGDLVLSNMVILPGRGHGGEAGGTVIVCSCQLGEPGYGKDNCYRRNELRLLQGCTGPAGGGLLSRQAREMSICRHGLVQIHIYLRFGHESLALCQNHVLTMPHYVLFIVQCTLSYIVFAHSLSIKVAALKLFVFFYETFLCHAIN